MGYTTLKAALDAVVKTNGQQQITGANLNGVMTRILQGVDILDRANPADTSGMNKVVLDKSKTFAEQVTATNTIYEIRDSFELGSSVTIPAGCVLYFKGGKISGGLLNLNGAILSGDVMILSDPAWNENNEFAEGYKPANLCLPVSWFGAKGDGSSDDAPAIQRAIKWLHKNGSTLVFDKSGTYILGDGISNDADDPDKTKHSGYSYPADYPLLTNDWTGISDKQTFLEQNPNDIGRDITLNFFKFSDLTIEGNGATIKSHDNNGYVRHNEMVRFWLCNNLSVKDITIDANREGRMSIYQSPYWSDLSIGPSFVNLTDLHSAMSLKSYLDILVTWQDVTMQRGKIAGSRLVYSLTLTGCSDVILDGVNSVNGVVDGMAISNIENRRISIRNGKFAHNQRHGIWLGACADVTIDSCVFEYAGYKLDNVTKMYMTGNTGACAHIDCENDSASFISKNNIIRHCAFGVSAKTGVVLSRAFEYSKILHCEFDSSIYSYQGRNCFCNEIGFCSFKSMLDSFHQEGMNFHHNSIVVTISDTSTHDFANYEREFSDTYVRGGESGKSSVVPSYFCNNVFRVEYGSDITSENRNTSCRFKISDNIIIRDNVFWNLDVADSGSGSFAVNCKEFSGNTFLFDTEKYPWLALNPNRTTSSGFSSRYDVKISNQQVRQSYFDIERRGSEKVIRIAKPYGASTRYMIIKNALSCATIKMYATGVTASAPQLMREYYIHGGYSISAQDRAVWVKDYYGKDSSNEGGLRTDFSGVYEIDTKLTTSGQPVYIEIHIPFSGYIPPTEEIISYQSGQYSFTGTIVTATDISQMQQSVPTLANRNRGQFNGATIFDSGIGKLCVKNETKFVDVNGFTPGKASGATADRPSATASDVGLTFFDTTLGKMIVWNGSAWVNMDGTALA